jgi:cobaltochelatase CobT
VRRPPSRGAGVLAATAPAGLGAAESAAVYRALASLPGRALAPDPATHEAALWRVLMAERPRGARSAAIARWRGRLDAFALRTRYTDLRCFRRHEPDGTVARRLYALLEQVRVEALGARRFAGMGGNLAALAQEPWIRTRPEGVIRGDAATWVDTFALLTRAALGAPLPEAARASLLDRWRSWMSPQQASEVEALAALLEEQDGFDAQARRVVEAVLRAAPRPEPEPEPPPAPERAGDASREAPANAAPAGLARQPGADPTAADAALSQDGRHAAPPEARAPYRVQSTEFDVTVSASELYDAATLARGRVELDRRLGGHVGRIMRWAHRLQRKLLALQQRSWAFDLEEGLLDASRLTRVATRPLEPLAYKVETDSAFPETVVTLLVDNSGSMRGVPIATAAVCAELLGRVLERCGVRTEILGFTTRCWHGGRPRRQWVTAGCPAGPGRLTELCHIVYKSADEPWRRASHRLGAMLQDGLLKENVDGEALLWAASRLRARTERRRILVVISDGAPLDEATLAANDTLYLDRHLRAVIAGIERERALELAAIGIGHDVTAYYRRAVMLPDVEALEEALVGQLIDLFEAPGAGHR